MQVQLTHQAVSSVFRMPSPDGAFAPDQREYMRELGNRRPSIFLVFPPKAAGTFLREAVVTATGGDLVRVVHAQGGRDAQLYYPTLLAYYLGGVCHGPLTAHVHMQALPANVAMMEAFGLRPVIMIRNIPDMLASFRDMLDHDAQARSDGLNCPIPENWLSLAPEQKADFLIDMMGPWYAGYYATWLARARQSETVRVLRYGELLEDPAGCLESILEHSLQNSRLRVSRPYCELVMLDLWDMRQRLRFNEGKEGRGRQYFSVAQRQRLSRLLGFYGLSQDEIAELV